MTRRGCWRALLALRARPMAPSAAAKDSWPARKAKHLVSSLSSMEARLPWPMPTLRSSATEPGMQKHCMPSPSEVAISTAFFCPFLSAMAAPRM